MVLFVIPCNEDEAIIWKGINKVLNEALLVVNIGYRTLALSPKSAFNEQISQVISIYHDIVFGNLDKVNYDYMNLD